MNHRIERGDCVASVAFEHGFFPDTVWEHADNSSLRRKRKDGNVLLEGDLLFIPERSEKVETRAPESRHVFRRRGVPERLNVRILDSKGEPRPRLPFLIEIDGATREGKTDADGFIRMPIPPDALSGIIFLGEGSTRREIPISLGHLDPVENHRGLCQRLSNLGFSVGDPSKGLEDPTTRAAIEAFRSAQGLEARDSLDDEFRAALQAEHQS